MSKSNFTIKIRQIKVSRLLQQNYIFLNYPILFNSVDAIH